jgi:hypothetical protein
MNVKISYCITVCREFIEIQRLINFLLEHKRVQDNIVVLFDEKNGDKEIENYLRSHSVNAEFSWYKGEFNRNFADWKNKLNSYATGTHIFNIDADEIPHEELINQLPHIIELNHDVEAYWVPRINTLSGDEFEVDQYVAMMGWNMNDQRWINFSDPQLRIFINRPDVKWEGEVHETVKGYKTVSRLPNDEHYCLYHPKTLSRQIEQNNLYATL